MLERIATALESSANPARTEDADARAALAGLHERVKALEARPVAGADAATVARVAVLEAEKDKLLSQLRSLRAKVFRDPEFHTPAAKAVAEEQDEGSAPLDEVLGGPGWGVRA